MDYGNIAGNCTLVYQAILYAGKKRGAAHKNKRFAFETAPFFVFIWGGLYFSMPPTAAQAAIVGFQW
ncbi:MAG: hypothetical protein SPD11_08015 [Sphaerochaetaceae bacterium]|nr:hypothetical protein [Sphaerochaetaceae bacterium]